MRSIAKQVQDKHKRVMRKTLREHNFMSNPTFLECKFSFKLLQVLKKYSCFCTLMANDRFQTCRLMETSMLLLPWEGLKFGHVFGCQRHSDTQVPGKTVAVCQLWICQIKAFISLLYESTEPTWSQTLYMQALRREEGIPDLNQMKSVLVSYSLKSKRDENP